MKLFKLGLLAVTLSLVAVVIAMDKKNDGGCEFDLQNDSDDVCGEECSEVVIEENVEENF